MNTKQPGLDWRDWREVRRRPWELKHQGWKHEELAALATCNQTI